MLSEPLDFNCECYFDYVVDYYLHYLLSIMVYEYFECDLSNLDNCIDDYIDYCIVLYSIRL